MGKLEDFLKEHKECYEGFNRFIGSKITFKPVESGKLCQCTITTDLNKVVSEFFKNNVELLKNISRNRATEKCYLEELEKAKTDAIGRIENDDLKKEAEKKFDKIVDIFSSVFVEKLPITSVIKQCEQRFGKRIIKYPFPKEQARLVYYGLFLIMLVHYFAWKNKTKSEENKISSNPDHVKDKIAPKAQKIDSIFNNPFYFNEPFPQYDRIPELERKYWKYIFNYGTSECKLSTEYTDSMCEWINKNRRKLEPKSIFNKETQEGSHKLLVTLANINYPMDSFVQYIFSPKLIEGGLYNYAYYFKNSTKGELKVNGKGTGLTIYVRPPGEFKIEDLEWIDANLKPIWFRDITKDEKKYKKITIKDLRDIAEEYTSLLQKKIIKYIGVTYQCDGDHILVSFKTNHFELPPVVLSEKDFSELFNGPNRGTVLFRGIGDNEFGPAIKWFAQMKKEGISYNVNKHNKQDFGAGIYWTQDRNFAKHYGGIIAMSISCEKVPPDAGDFITDQSFRDMFLQRDNQCLFIRGTAMVDERTITSKKLAEIKNSPEAKNIVFCKTDEDVDNWLNCR